MWRGTGTGSSERLWMPCHWKCSRPGWMNLWATWSTRRCPCPQQGSWTKWLLSVLSNPNHMWFCGAENTAQTAHEAASPRRKTNLLFSPSLRMMASWGKQSETSWWEFLGSPTGVSGIPHLAQSNSMQDEMLKDGSLGRGVPGKDPDILLDKLNMSHLDCPWGSQLHPGLY